MDQQDTFMVYTARNYRFFVVWIDVDQSLSKSTYSVSGTLVDPSPIVVGADEWIVLRPVG